MEQQLYCLTKRRVHNCAQNSICKFKLLSLTLERESFLFITNFRMGEIHAKDMKSFVCGVVNDCLLISGERPFKCTECGERYMRQMYLDKHIGELPR